jgi:hypothetical protein
MIPFTNRWRVFYIGWAMESTESASNIAGAQEMMADLAEVLTGQNL